MKDDRTEKPSDKSQGPFPPSVFPKEIFPRSIFPWMGDDDSKEETNETKK